ncbi:SusC/RagA family TonB-linked outer membrane protein [Viscerimonas tarda]
MKKTKRVWRSMLVFSLLFLCSNAMFAQQKTLTGVVKETNGEPVIGAVVLVKGTSAGTATDMDGKFTLKTTDGKTLVVSYLGFVTKEVPINGTTFDIVLEENSTSLDEVVVIGYGSVKKRDLTGSVSSIQGTEIAKIPVTSTAQALTGRLAGVQITTSDGSPDAEMIIRVRGGGSITGDNTPLYIVDGFPVGSISDVAPTDIQDIVVLKDASSTAIYGSRGANGVVLITTKNAQAGKTKISYNGYLQGKSLAKKIDVMDPYSFVMFNYEKALVRNQVSSFEKKYGAYDDLDLYKYQKGADWQEDMFSHAGISQSHNINVTGGTDITKFSLSGTYLTDNSLMRDNGYNRFNLNFKLDHKLASNLKLDFGVRVSDTQTKGAGTSGGTYKVRSYEAMMRAPVNGLADFTVFDPSTLSDEELDQYLTDNMTQAEKAAQYWRRKTERRYNFTGALDWNILKNLTYRLEGGYNYLFNEQKDWYGAKSEKAIKDGNSLPMAEWDKKNSYSYRIANTLTWDTELDDKNKFNVMLGHELNQSGSESMGLTGKGFQKDIAPEKTFASLASNSGEIGSRIISSSLAKDTKMVSLFGRLNYNYNERYLLTLTFRGDGSSKFQSGNRWGYFPAGALAWRVSEEDFMAGTQDYLSNLKLRLSYGEVGNNNIGNGLFETLYKAYSGGKNYGAGSILNPHYTLANSQMANPTLKWETTVTRNVAIDYGFFRERLSGSLEYYWNTTRDLLVIVPTPAVEYSTVQKNIGQTSNRGVELSLNAALVQQKDFSLNFNFNVGFNKNKVDKLTGDINIMDYQSGAFSTDTHESDDYRVIVGQPVGLIYGFVYDGVYQADDFETYTDANGRKHFQFDSSGKYILRQTDDNGNPIPSNAYSSAGSNAGLRPGAVKLKNLNPGEDNVIDAKDRQVIGKTTPKNTGGFGLNATYKGFDLSAMFNWVYGNSVYNMDKIVTTQSYRNTNANLRDYMNPATSAWTYLDRSTGELVNDYETLKAMNAGKSYWSPLTIPDNNPLVSSWAVEDGSYLRFQNLTVGYTLPATLTKKFACSQLRLYCTLNNLYTWTSYTGYDPEVSSSVRGSSVGNITPGVDYSVYPKSFSWTAGVNITF